MSDEGRLESLIQVALHKSGPRRRRAVYDLGEMRDRRAVESLIKILREPHSRSITAEALGKIGDSRALPPLERVMATDRNWPVRRDAAIALGRIAHEASADALLGCVQDDSSDSVRVEAARALGRIGLVGVEHLRSLLYNSRANSGDAYIRGIEQVSDPASVPVLMDVQREAFDEFRKLHAQLNAIGAAMPPRMPAVTDRAFVEELMEVTGMVIAGIGADAIPYLKESLSQYHETNGLMRDLLERMETAEAAGAYGGGQTRSDIHDSHLGKHGRAKTPAGKKATPAILHFTDGLDGAHHTVKMNVQSVRRGLRPLLDEDEPAPGHSLVGVRMYFINAGDLPITIDPISDAWIQDESGNRYSWSDVLIQEDEHYWYSDSLEPSEKCTNYLVFEVPKRVRLVRLHVETLDSSHRPRSCTQAEWNL